MIVKKKVKKKEYDTEVKINVLNKFNMDKSYKQCWMKKYMITVW